MLVGVISDTHGRLNAGVERAFEGVGHIIHAGDIGARRVLDELGLIAPVTAVRGNAEHDELAWRLNDTAVITLADRRIMVFHQPDSETVPDDVEVVVNGHTHRSRAERIDGVLFVNPGSAGMRGRDGRGPTVALLDLSGSTPEAHIVDL